MNPPENAKRILIAVNKYVPDNPRMSFSVMSLVKLGYDVSLIGAARQKGNTFVDTKQVRRGARVRIVPHVDTLNGGIFRTIWQLITGRLPDQLLAKLGKTNVLSMLIFNLWILRIGLFSRTDIIVCHDISPLPACWLLSVLKRQPLVYDVPEDVPTMYTGFKGRLMTWMERTLIKRAAYAIAAGQRLADALPERGAKHVVHIGNWKPLEEYEIRPEDAQALRRKWNIPEDAFVISFLGTLDENRELPALLDVVASSPDVYLMIAGRGEHRDLVLEFAEKHDNIIWLNWVDLTELPLYTVAADVMYYCRSGDMPGGSYEIAPAPNKLYEAFAAGCPLIAVQGVGEIGAILEEIPAGILVDAVTSETIKNALDQLRDPTIYAEKKAAALTARDRYNWGRAEQLLADVYAQVS